MLPQLNSAQNVPLPRMLGVLAGVGKSGTGQFYRDSHKSTLELWLRSDSIVGLNNGDSVTLWPDWSGKPGRDATPGTAPVFTLNVANGWPGVTFNGATNNRFLQGNLDVTVAGGGGGSVAPSYTMFAVSRMAVASFQGAVAETANGGVVRTGGAISQQTANRRFHYAPAGETTPGFFAQYAFSSTSVTLHVGRYSGLTGNAGPQIYQGAVSQAANNGTIGGSNMTGYRIGRLMDNTAPFNGDILEVGVYSHALTDVEISQLAAYCTQRYGTP